MQLRMYEYKCVRVCAFVCVCSMRVYLCVFAHACKYTCVPTYSCILT